MSDKLTIGEGWIMAECGGKTVLGKIVAPPVEAPEPAEEKATDSGTLVSEREPGASLAEAAEDPEDDALFLMPCYEIHRAGVQTPQGLSMQMQAVPYGLIFAHPVPVMVAAPNFIVQIGDLDESDRLAVVTLVRQAEEMKTRLRGERSGLQLVGRG
jgi:hypothetical protein